MLPLQSAMTVTLPTVAGGQAGHNPFPDHLIYIKGIEDTVSSYLLIDDISKGYL